MTRRYCTIPYTKKFRNRAIRRCGIQKRDHPLFFDTLQSVADNGNVIFHCFLSDIIQFRHAADPVMACNFSLIAATAAEGSSIPSTASSMGQIPSPLRLMILSVVISDDAAILYLRQISAAPAVITEACSAQTPKRT